MKIEDFEKELQEINKDISIVHPENGLPGLSSVNYKGVSLCGCPQFEIFDEPNEGYAVEIMGMMRRHRTTEEIRGTVVATLERLKDKDENDAFFGQGEYKDERK